MDNQNQTSLEEYLVYEDKQKLNTFKTTLTVRPTGAYLSLVGVDTPELLDVFKNYLLTFQNTKIFHCKSEQIIDEIIDSNEEKTLIIDIFNLKNSFKIENIIQNFRFNRDFIPDKNIRIFIIASNDTLDKFSEKAYDFVTFTNFYGQFKNNKFDFEYKVNREKLDNLIVEYKNLKPNAPKIVQLEKLSMIIDEAVLIKNTNIAIKYLNIALKKSKKLDNRYFEILYLCNFGELYSYSKPEKSLFYYDKALSIAKQISSLDDIARILSNKANVYKECENFDEALILLNMSILINTQIDRKSGLAINYANIGAIYDGGDNKKAMEYYLKSLKIQEELNITKGIAINYNNIGHILCKLYNFDESLIYLNKALNISKINSYTEIIISSLINFGLVYNQLLNFKLAVQYFTEALKLSKSAQLEKLQSKCETNISEINKYLMINGKEHTEYVITKPNKIDDKDDITKYLMYEANILKEEKKYNEVKNKLQEAEKIADEINLKGSQCEVYMAFYDYYKTINDEKNAQSYYNKANYIIKNSGHKLFEKRLEDIKQSHIK